MQSAIPIHIGKKSMTKDKDRRCGVPYAVKDRKTGEIIYVGSIHDLLLFFNTSRHVIQEAIDSADHVLLEDYFVSLANEHEKSLVGTFKYLTMADVKRAKSRGMIVKNYGKYQKIHGMPCRYKGSSSVRFTPL